MYQAIISAEEEGWIWKSFDTFLNSAGDTHGLLYISPVGLKIHHRADSRSKAWATYTADVAEAKHSWRDRAVLLSSGLD